MASLMESGPSPAIDPAQSQSQSQMAGATSATDIASGSRSTGRAGSGAGTGKAAKGASATNKPVKASKTKTPNGTNSDHRKEQNRIASRNYREKRKHKLALLQQILHEPSASESNSTTQSTSASNAAAVPSHVTDPSSFGSIPLAATLDNSLADVLPDFQPILSGLIAANMLAPSSTDSTSASASATSTAGPTSNSTATTTDAPLDEFAAWAASNLPAAVAANSPRNKSSGSPSAGTSTSASITGPSLSSTTTAETLLDMPMLQPWLIPFSSDQESSFTPFLAHSSLNGNNAVTSSSFSTVSTTAPSTTATSAPDSGPGVTETVDIDESFDPAIDVDQFMSGSDNNHSTNNGNYSDLLMRPDFSTSYYATSNYQALQGTFVSSTPAEIAAAAAAAAITSSIPLPFSAATPSSRQEPVRPGNTTTLPSRPSPLLYAQTLASPSNSNSNSPAPPPNFLPYTMGTPKATASSSSPAGNNEPSRRTRKKNKPVVRAMLQYVQTLSPHQKRLILQALLDGEGGDEEGDNNSNPEGMDEDDDDRVEEIGNGDDNDSDGTMGKESKEAAKKSAFISRREDRRRQVVARWNSGRFAGEGGSFSSSSSASSTSSPASGASSIDATNFANIALSGFDGPNGLTGPIHHGQPPSGIYGANFGADPGARPYFPVPLMVMNLQCRRMGFRAAVMQNCLACGLTNPDLMFDESACYDEDLEPGSPFALNADEAKAVVLQGAGRIAAVVAAVRQSLARSGKTPPRDLQPVDAQILVAHHPYIDVIPFRGFRARALALLAEMEAAEEVAAAVAAKNNADGTGTPPGGPGGIETPCLLDEDELCYDMNVAEGLVCWGSQMGNGGAGLSSQAKRDSDSARDMRACLPWDMRSWEPQVWFLKKYWFLVGGWDDDMWRNCRWWHSMRGDELDYSVYASPGY